MHLGPEWVDAGGAVTRTGKSTATRILLWVGDSGKVSGSTSQEETDRGDEGCKAKRAERKASTADSKVATKPGLLSPMQVSPEAIGARTHRLRAGGACCPRIQSFLSRKREKQRPEKEDCKKEAREDSLSKGTSNGTKGTTTVGWAAKPPPVGTRSLN